MILGDVLWRQWFDQFCQKPVLYQYFSAWSPPCHGTVQLRMLGATRRALKVKTGNSNIRPTFLKKYVCLGSEMAEGPKIWGSRGRGRGFSIRLYRSALFSIHANSGDRRPPQAPRYRRPWGIYYVWIGESASTLFSTPSFLVSVKYTQYVFIRNAFMNT